MKIEKIFSLRSFERHLSFHIVYDWEDIYAKKLNAKLSGLFTSFLFKGKISGIIRKINLSDVISKVVFNKTTLAFQMTATTTKTFYNYKNIVPFIIDFWLSKEDIPLFEEAYKENPIVVISSRQAYDFLKENGCSLNIIHVPLSLPDYLIQHAIYDKQYDVAMIGRNSPIFEKYFERYVNTHTNIHFVHRTYSGGAYSFYNEKNECISKSNSRETYLTLLRKSKCVFYSTPGLDGDRKDTNGFSQVTPRFLEYLSCGCNIIMRYQHNSDVIYYELPTYWDNVESYQEFEDALDKAIHKNYDEHFYYSFLVKHSTSAAAEILLSELSK